MMILNNQYQIHIGDYNSEGGYLFNQIKGDYAQYIYTTSVEEGSEQGSEG